MEEYRHKINGTGCGEDFYDDWVYYCVGDTIRRHQLFHDFFCDDVWEICCCKELTL